MVSLPSELEDLGSEVLKDSTEEDWCASTNPGVATLLALSTIMVRVVVVVGYLR